MKYTPKTTHKIRKLYLRRKTSCLFKQSLQKGSLGLISKVWSTILPRQLEVGRRFLTRKLKKKMPVSVPITVTQPATKKSKNARMGGGSGKVIGWFGYIRPGKVLYEVDYYYLLERKNWSLEKINKKLQFKCKISLQSSSLQTLKKELVKKDLGALYFKEK